MLDRTEIWDFRRAMGRRLRELRSVLFELDRMQDVESVRYTMREIQSEMAWAKVQLEVCADMLKLRKETAQPEFLLTH